MNVPTVKSLSSTLRRAAFFLVLFAFAGLAARVEGQGCSVGVPTDFEPNPPGPTRPASLSAAYNSNLSLYRAGSGGPWRLLLQESFGYSVLDLSNPANPTVVRWDDLRYDPSNADSNPIPQHGDGQSYIQTVAVSPDGFRAAFSVSGPGEPNWHTMVGRPDSNSGFGIWGDFGDSRASGTVVQQVGSRYIAYSILGTAAASAADVTTMPTALGSLNLASSSETTNWPAGTGLGLAGGFLYYISGSSIQVIDATTPGPVGSITAAYKTLSITSAMVPDFGGRTPQYVTGAVDPASANKLWLLVALAPIIGQENSPSYGLVSVTRDGGPLPAPVSAGAAYRIPSVAGETWVNVGPASSLVVKNGTLYALMWSNRRAPSYRFGMFSTTVAAWPTASTTASTSFVANPSFSVGSAMGFIDGPGNTLFGYAASGDAWVVPFSCASPDTPATSSLTAVDDSAGGAAVADGGTVFVGDQLTFVPSVVPGPASRPLTSWSFDFDFHAGNAIEDALTSPRVKNPDLSLAVNGPTPPASITVVGPCDPMGVPAGVPVTGVGCWTSVLGNAASGGPDFTALDPAGTTKPLKVGFEATNSLGIANTAVFTVNWKIPAARVASTQVLSGLPLVSASDGHPIAYKWYFGTAPSTLLVSGCAPTAYSCTPTAGSTYYWLTAIYANGYSTPDYVAGTTPGQPFTITSFVPVFTVNGASAGPITVYTYQTLLIQNNSQRGSGITATYQVSLCQPAPCADNFVALGLPDSAGASTAIAVPTTPGSYALKIRANYTGTSSGSATWPDPATTPNGFPLTVSAAPPPIVVSVSANPNPANHGDTVQLTCSATGGTGSYTGYEWSTTAGTFSSQQNPTFHASNLSSADVTLPATCTVHDTAGGQGLNTVNVTIRKGAAATPISVNAYASPNPAIAGNQVTLTCLATGGNGSYSYAWYGPTGPSFSSQQVFTFTASNGSSSDITSRYTCTVSDTAGSTGSNYVDHSVRASGTPTPSCTPFDYTLKDYLSQQTIVPVGAGQFSAYQVSVGQALQFVPTVSTFTTYSWTFGDGNTSSQPSPQFAYQTGGTRTATLTASGGNACVTPVSYTIIVSGPTGNFSAAYEDSTAITYSNVTAFKNIVFTAFDAPGAVDAYSWDFGDNTAHATGQTPPAHAFAPGTWTVKLTVTKGTASVNQTLVLTVIPPPEPPKWVVPGMAYSLGQVPGTTWQSDVTIFNPHATIPAKLSVAFLDARNPVDDYSKLTWGAITVPPLGSIASPNLLGGAFGQPLGAYGALMVRGDVTPLAPVITARTFNNGDPAKGTFGLSVPPASVSGGVSTQASLAASVLVGLRQNASANTNIGLVNLKNDWAKVQLDFFDGGSVNHLAQKVVDLAPYQSLQISRALLDAGYDGTSDLYAVTVKINQGTAVYPYATVIDLNSTDPIVVTPTEAPSNAYRVPGIIRLAGANGEKWRSRVTLTNMSGASRKVHLVFSYVACNTNGCSNLNSTQGDVNMTPGQTQQWDDFVKVWLTVKGFIPVDDATSYASSVLDVSPAVGDPIQDPVIVLGETYNDTPTGHVGLQIPGYTPLDGASRVGAYKRLALTGLAATPTYRTNIALFVVAGTTGKWVGAHVYGVDGTKLRDIPVFVDGFVQISSSTLFGGLPGDLSRMSVVVDNLDDGITVGGYATIIDNTSGDATFVKATPVP